MPTRTGAAFALLTAGWHHRTVSAFMEAEDAQQAENQAHPCSWQVRALGLTDRNKKLSPGLNSCETICCIYCILSNTVLLLLASCSDVALFFVSLGLPYTVITPWKPQKLPSC